MSTILKPLDSGTYTVGKGVLHFYPLADASNPDSYNKGYRLGDCDGFSVQVEVTESERFSNEYSVRTLALKTVDEIAASVSVTVAQLSDIVRAAAVLGEETVVTQDAETGATKNLGTPSDGVYFLGAFGVTNVSVSVGATELTAGTDFLLDATSGQLEILMDQSGGDDVLVTYDVPAIAQGFATGIASGTGMRGMLMYRGVNAQGKKSLLQLWDVELRPANARDYISESEIQTVELTGTAYPVGGKPEGLSIGFEKALD